MDGIALLESEIPEEAFKYYPLKHRRHKRESGECEYRFLTVQQRREIPVWLHGQFRIVTWGNLEIQCILPRPCWTWQKSISAGSWQGVRFEMALIPANMLAVNGYWMPVLKGLKALVAYDGCDQPHAYVVCKEPSNYFKNMTRSEKQPMLFDEDDI